MLDCASVSGIDGLGLLLVLDLDRDVIVCCCGVVFDLCEVKLEARLGRLSDNFAIIVVAMLV